MLVNYILVAQLMHVPADGQWLNLKIQKPHTYITECLADGRAWQEKHTKQAIRNVGKNNKAAGVVFSWGCMPANGNGVPFK